MENDYVSCADGSEKSRRRCVFGCEVLFNGPAEKEGSAGDRRGEQDPKDDPEGFFSDPS